MMVVEVVIRSQVVVEELDLGNIEVGVRARRTG